jgi:hypothetical protein
MLDAAQSTISRATHRGEQGQVRTAERRVLEVERLMP